MQAEQRIHCDCIFVRSFGYKCTIAHLYHGSEVGRSHEEDDLTTTAGNPPVQISPVVNRKMGTRVRAESSVPFCFTVYQGKSNSEKRNAICEDLKFTHALSYRDLTSSKIAPMLQKQNSTPASNAQ
jgi:hypothetical protein